LHIHIGTLWHLLADYVRAEEGDWVVFLLSVLLAGFEMIVAMLVAMILAILVPRVVAIVVVLL
jgi:hypothetical protein